MRDISACFFCTTPFQIMAAICLVKERNIRADLYIQNQFKQAEEIAKKVKSEQLFENVIVVDDLGIKNRYLTQKNIVELRLKLAATYLHVDEIAESILIPDTHYDEMYVSTKQYVARFVYLYLVKKKSGTMLVYYDDGEGSYDNERAFIPRMTDKIIRYLLFGKKSLGNVHTRYLYSPELYYRLHPGKTDLDIREIPCIWKDEEPARLLARIFSLTDDTKISEPVIFIDTLRTPETVSMNKMVDAVMRLLSTQFGKDSIMIKKHPRDLENKNEGYKYYQHNGVPFEALCTQMDMDKKLMVIIQSTAAVMPKLLLNKEPYVIVLYKLIEGYKVEPQSEAFYEACAASYGQTDKFFIPATMDELSRAVQQISSRGLQ